MIKGETYTVHIGSNLDILPTLPDNSVDSIVTDPPYGLSDNKYIDKTLVRWISGERDFIPDGKGFMGKSWDAFVPPPALWDECLRVLKPGGHLLAFFGSRTQDIGALSIRLAGFEIRDSIAWMYGSGFPKSLDISKAIDKAAGAEREVIGQKITGAAMTQNKTENSATNFGSGQNEVDITAPATPEAQQWEGWGTALKPAFEPIVVARKPLIGTVAENVLTHGTGGLNIDGSRIGTGEGVVTFDRTKRKEEGKTYDLGTVTAVRESNQGRWPSNVILDPYTAELLDEQSGTSKAKPARTGIKGGNSGALGEFGGSTADAIGHWPEDLGGGASRFFYVAKASKRDRNEGLEELDPQRHSDRENAEGVGGDNPRNRTNNARQNFHPTVKPTDLMRYLVKLVTPPGGTVLDPFTGSGSTGKAAILEGFRFIGCELTEDYIPIIEGRLAHAEKTVAERKEKEDEALF
jgi:DNA modification methylase